MTVRLRNLDDAGLDALLVRVDHPDGSVDEVYVGEGTTLGRGPGSTIVVDQPSVARRHARITSVAEGLALVCEEGSTVGTGGTESAAVALGQGVVFVLGDARFECLSVLPGRLREPGACPICADDVRSHAATVRCSNCGTDLLVVSQSTGERHVLPRDFRGWRAEGPAAFGGMGVVLRGVEVHSGRPVAIKCARRDGERERVRRSVSREVAALRDLRSPYVVELLGSGRIGCVPFLVMDWVEGATLRAAIGDDTIPFEEILGWFRDVCLGLEEIHARGLVHGDVKPGNVLLQEGRPARLSDLGISRPVPSEPSMTRTGDASGTYRYMSPERLGGAGPVDARSDLFSLAVTFYEVLTGRTPAGAWRPASELCARAPRWFDEILSAALASDPNDRPSSAGELLSRAVAVRAVPSASEVQRAPVPPRTQWSTHVRGGVAAVVRRAAWLAGRHPVACTIAGVLLAFLVLVVVARLAGIDPEAGRGVPPHARGTAVGPSVADPHLDAGARTRPNGRATADYWNRTLYELERSFSIPPPREDEDIDAYIHRSTSADLVDRVRTAAADRDGVDPLLVAAVEAELAATEAILGLLRGTMRAAARDRLSEPATKLEQMFRQRMQDSEDHEVVAWSSAVAIVAEMAEPYAESTAELRRSLEGRYPGHVFLWAERPGNASNSGNDR